MYWSASVLTTNSADTEPTVILTFDSAKYVFNAGENTIRAWLCSKQSFRKTRAIFVTSVGTQRCSGVAGLLMSLSDASINKLDVVGPEGLAHLIATMRSYTYRSSLSVNPIEASFKAITAGMQSPSPIYEDGNISAYAIPLFPSFSSSLTHSQPSVELDQPERTAKRKRSASPPSSSKRPLFDEQNDSAAPFLPKY
ncbi:Ribonuclease Z, mitochondrial [Grifola frondosa]|uniref:ribonuclease Z n=1 Tax=Grifola frondosa TaxID=5627 RepID=A0A1C7MKM5_GRIFR|nr:Ribonuclease Z, mitochondrial [Grifola frondosa]